MNLVGPIVLVAAFTMIYYFQQKTQCQETFLTPPRFPALNDIYTQRINELENTDRVLERKIVTGKQEINNLGVPLSKPHVTDVYKRIRPLQKRTFRFKDIKKATIAKSDPLNTLIDDRQPYMFDQPEVVNYYGKNHYWDWRYPKKPISVEFAADPAGYCQKYPQKYPSYVIASRRVLR